MWPGREGDSFDAYVKGERIHRSALFVGVWRQRARRAAQQHRQSRRFSICLRGAINAQSFFMPSIYAHGLGICVLVCGNSVEQRSLEPSLRHFACMCARTTLFVAPLAHLKPYCPRKPHITSHAPTQSSCVAARATSRSRRGARPCRAAPSFGTSRSCCECVLAAVCAADCCVLCAGCLLLATAVLSNQSKPPNLPLMNTTQHNTTTTPARSSRTPTSCA